LDELSINLHMHTIYSDGTGTHADIARAAIKSGLDVILVTDHNTWVQGFDGYIRQGTQRVLLLAGEEIHDQARDPQKNHLLVFGAEKELSTLAYDPQLLVNSVRDAGGLSFLAHPVDPALPLFGETDISWVDWDVTGFTGLELWNGFSELKAVIHSRLDGAFYSFFPQALAHGPAPAAISIWDKLLNTGRKIVAVGGSDAHALHLSLGPIPRVVFPYEYHFSAVNTHLLVPHPLLGKLEQDKQMVYSALAAGHCFIGYDLPASTRGFRFSAKGVDNTVSMGDEIPALGGVTLQVNFPAPPSEAYLIRNGIIIQKTSKVAMAHTTAEPGVYRVEAYLHFLGQRRAWIFSNPIYIK
jgi:hypothetical protein